MSESRKFVVLDRDGVINRDSSDYIKCADEWLALPGSIEAICRLHQAGFTVVVASNQSGLGRGLFSDVALAEIHDKMNNQIEQGGGQLAGVFFCPHLPDAGCDCRKPATGLLQAIETEFGQSLQGAVFVGDSLKDLQAATRHKIEPVLVRTGNGATTETKLASHGLAHISVYDDLAAFTHAFLG